MDLNEAVKNTQQIHQAINRLNSIILGKDEVVRKVMVALLSRGHVLIEDVPGVGKTTLAKSLADILDCRFQRISFTSDLMPSDILGITIFNRNQNEFLFQEGPIFTNILLADELNRTTPKTQSAFLEAMDSGQVTIEKKTYPLPDPFLVMATQNPLEFAGTFPLPVSQLDRFLMRIEMGYPDPLHEEKMLVQYRAHSVLSAHTAPSTEAKTLTAAHIRTWQELVPQIRVEASLVTYLTQLAAKTRTHADIHLGVSPRGALALQRAAQAMALLSGRAYVIPDDIQSLLPSVWAHRMILKNQTGIGTHAQHRALELIGHLMREVNVPV